MIKKRETSYEEIFAKDKYKLIVLDMDGTLYYQRSMQILMCLEMGAFGVMHPFSLWKLKTVSVFRKIREEQGFATEGALKEQGEELAKTDILMRQYAKTAEIVGQSKEAVQQVIEEWMFARPLKYLQLTADTELLAWVGKWKAVGKKVVVYSDYPVREKCEILKVQADAMFSSDEMCIGQMKPSAKGLEVICGKFGTAPEDILVVGDRMSKDGKMAETFGCEYVILKKWKIFRKKRYGFHNF